MDKHHSHHQPRSSNTLFGLGRKPHQPGERTFAADEHTTGWELYNERAWKIDKESIKDWNDSLNTLLIFVSDG